VVLIGREAVCARIDELLLRGRGGRSGALLVRGEAGIGKTSLLEYAVERSGGMTVIRALGVESEAELRCSGLLELLRPLLDHLAELPQPQADALRHALGLGGTGTFDRFTIGAATLNLLATAAESNPLLVVVDDAQWLDGATTEALLFAAKRLVADAVVLLFAARADTGDEFELPGFEPLDLPALTSEDAARLLEEDADRAPTPAVAQRLWEATGGNPLALLEARRLLGPAQLDGREALPEPVPAGAALERAFAGRAEQLSPGSRHALLVAAVSLAHETGVETIGAALAAMGLDANALESAEDAGLIAIEDGRLAFRHPLVRSAVYHSAPPSERRAAHRALADSMRETGEPEHRAWHLAGAALGPDEEAAAALEVAAQHAGERSGYGAAAAALARAADLTTDEDARLRRLHAAADAAFRAGHAADATALLAEPLAAELEPRFRAEVLRLQARIEYLAARPERTSAALLEASALLEDVDRKLSIEVATEACSTLHIVGDAHRLLDTARRANALAAELGDEAVSRLALFTLGWALCYAGRPADGVPLVEETAASAEAGGDGLDPLEILRASLALDWLDRSREAFAVSGRAADETRRRGAVGLLPYVLLQQGWHAVRAGSLEEGYATASEALGLARELGLQLPRMQALLTLTAVTARRGAEEECRAYADEIAELAETAGIPVFRIWRLYSLGVLSLGLGRFDDAARDFEAAAAGLEELGLHSPSFVPRAELVEVHVRAGRAEDAAAALYRYAASPEAECPLGRAAAARGRGLLASADDFETHFDDALAANERSDDRWSLARTRLALGERLRRAGRRAEAREHLRLALTAFEEMGAEPWLARAHSELRASGETLRRRKAWEDEQLTPQELQIALHVARGLTNREVGAALFLSHKTVEFHLGRIFRKLDMSSRAELIQRYGQAARDAEQALA
jgi:DNA-binding CsgD family transcriptional regulator